MEVEHIPTRGTIWAVVASANAPRWSRTTHICDAKGCATTFALPAGATHINLVCVAPLESGQYVTLWCAPATVTHTPKPVTTRVDGFRFHENHFHAIKTDVTVTGPASFTWMFTKGGRLHTNNQTEHMFTWYPRSVSVANGNPIMQFASACTFEGASNAHVWCRCIGASAAMAGIELGTKLAVAEVDALVQLGLRAPAGKYVFDRDYAGNITDNRDHPSMTYGAGKDCDGWAQFFCQHFYAMKMVQTSDIAAIRGNKAVVTAAVIAHRRLLQYAGACMFFGCAINPNNPGNGSFGHAWAGLLPPPPASSSSSSSSSSKFPPPTEILIAEPTAPLCANANTAMKRVYTAKTYPCQVDGVAFRGVRETLPKYYPEVWCAIGPTGSVTIKGSPAMHPNILTAAQIEQLCGDHQVTDDRIVWLLVPRCPMRLPPYFEAPVSVDALRYMEIASPGDSSVVGFSPLLAGAKPLIGGGLGRARILKVADNVGIAVILAA
jgi:hypothetical protein